MTQTVSDKVVARIYGKGRGWVFSQKDFAGLGSRNAVDMALIRLTDNSTIRRVIRGIYDYPRYSELLKQEMGPDIIKSRWPWLASSDGEFSLVGQRP